MKRRFRLLLPLAALVAASVALTGLAAEDWLYTVGAVDAGGSSCNVIERKSGTLVAYCYQRDYTVPDYVGIAVRARAGTLDYRWQSWITPAAAHSGTQLALDLIASLHPVAVWLQLFRIASYSCVFKLGEMEACRWPPRSSPFSQIVAKRHYKSVGWQTVGWKLTGWRAEDALITMQFADGMLFLFTPTDDCNNRSLSIWDDGLDSWNDGGSIGNWEVTLECSKRESD